MEIKNFYEGIVKFNFYELCDRNLGSEDYIYTLIDILYEKKIPLMITSNIDLKSINSSKSLAEPFKRTVSRLYELTSNNYN